MKETEAHKFQLYDGVGGIEQATVIRVSVVLDGRVDERADQLGDAEAMADDGDVDLVGRILGLGDVREEKLVKELASTGAHVVERFAVWKVLRAAKEGREDACVDVELAGEGPRVAFCDAKVLFAEERGDGEWGVWIWLGGEQGVCGGVGSLQGGRKDCCEAGGCE